jgi:hypothetical protein
MSLGGWSSHFCSQQEGEARLAGRKPFVRGPAVLDKTKEELFEERLDGGYLQHTDNVGEIWQNVSLDMGKLLDEQGRVHPKFCVDTLSDAENGWSNDALGLACFAGYSGLP